MYREDGAHIDENKRPFKCILDIGIYKSTTGNRCYGALKGFTDGGVFVKHNNKRFPGFKIIPPAEKGDKAKVTYDPEVHKNKIFGQFIDDHIRSHAVKRNELEFNKQQFSQWEKCLAASKTSSLPELYKKVHEAIRKEPFKNKLDVEANKKAREAKQKKAVRKSLGEGIWTDSKGRKWL